MSIELALVILIGITAMFAAMSLYIYVLLAIAGLPGILKYTIAFVVYLTFAIVIVTPLFYFIERFRENIDNSDLGILIPIVCFLVVVAPSYVYLFKYKIRELQSAGYFLPR